MSEDAKTRKYTRTNVDKKIPIHLDGFGDSDLVSLGFGGLYVTSASPLPVGTVVHLSLPLPDQEPPINVTAKVVYMHEGKGMGIEFIDLSVRDAERIGVFILLNN
ncbi:MAG TPA: PilZ domain-containing protein [Nitrospiria bacterium]|nr:PilZ domain-containing protein [Nitrospiria bacterium]